MERTFIIIFFSLLIMPFVLADFERNSDSSSSFISAEKRKKTDFGQVMESSLSNFPKKFKNWLNDNFKWRNQVLQLNTKLHSLLKVSPNPKDVIYGKEGYLFLGNNHRRIHSQLQGREPFSKSEIQRRLKRMTKEHKYLASKGIPLLVVPAPEKQSIYPEYLYLKNRFKLGSETRLDQLLANSEGLNVMDLRIPLLASKETYGNLLYNKTDSHWSSLGAFIAYRSIIDKMSEYIEIPRVLEIKDFKVLNHSGWGLAKGQYFVTKDFKIEIQLAQKLDKITKKGINNNKARAVSPLTTMAEGISINSKRNHKIVIIGDSFRIRFSPFFNQTFNEVIYLKVNSKEARNFELLVERFDPDFVIKEFVERGLR